jgi:uncharacterized protein YktA (UPF0223 family)
VPVVSQSVDVVLFLMQIEEIPNEKVSKTLLPKQGITAEAQEVGGSDIVTSKKLEKKVVFRFQKKGRER